MARYRIYNNGKPTQFFWSDKHGPDRETRTVFRQAETGVKRIKGVVFDSKAKKLRKE